MVIQLHPVDLLTLLFRRKSLFVLSMLMTIALGATYLILATPQYRSMAAVVVRFDDKTVSQTNLARDSTPNVTASSDRHEIVLAHASILSSPDLAQAVITKVGMAAIYPGILLDPPSRGTAMDEALIEFNRNLVIDPEQQGDVINISFDNPDPNVARQATQELIGGYMQREAEIFSHPDVEFQKTQQQKARETLRLAQLDLENYKRAGGITSFDDQALAMIKQRSDMNGALQAAVVTLAQAEQRRGELQRSLATLAPTVSNSASGEKYKSADEAQSTLDALRLKEQQLRATYRPDSPVLDQLQASIRGAAADLQARRSEVSRRDQSAPSVVFQNIQTDLLRAQADVRGGSQSVDLLTGQVAQLDQQMAHLEGLRSGLLQRSRAVDIADDTYRALSLQLQDALNSDGRLRESISHGAIIRQPSLPFKPSKPRYLILIAAFLVASVMVGALVIVIAELLDDRFTAPGQVARVLSLPVLATFGDLKT